jgi:Tfp pilus assembly protein PilP
MMRALVLFTALGVLTSATALHAQAKPTPAPQQPAPAPSTSAGQAKPAPAPPPPAKTPEKPAPAPAPQGAPPPAAAPAPQTSPAPPPAPEAYTYRPDGRRDPFLSLVGGSRDTGGLARRTDGPAGMNVGEITVRGILQSKGSLVAMVQGPDKKTYIVHVGDKFLDGTIKTITPQGLVVLQEVNDPLSLVKQREIRKLLKSLEDAKE